MQLNDLNTPNIPTWCPGCGNFGIWTAFKKAVIAENWNNSNTVLVAGIGCMGILLTLQKLQVLKDCMDAPCLLQAALK